MDEDNCAFNLSSDLYLHIVGCMHTCCGIFVHNTHFFFKRGAEGHSTRVLAYVFPFPSHQDGNE